MFLIGRLSIGLDWYQISFQSLFRKPIGSIIRFLFPLSGINTIFIITITNLNIPSNYGLKEILYKISVGDCFYLGV